MSFHIVKVYGDTNAWVGFLGTYFGSILSGAITLVGVFLTIRYSTRESQNAIHFTMREARKEKLPRLISDTQECIDYIDDCLEEIEMLNRQDIEEVLYQPSYERTLRLFEINYNYQLEQKPELKKLIKEHVKYIRKITVTINSESYKAYLQLDRDLQASYREHIDEIDTDISLFHATVMNEYFDTHDMIIASNDGKLIDIDLSEFDTETIQDIKSKLYYKEQDYLYGIRDSYEALKETLENTLMRLSEEFFHL
ncbi:hypothetical protein MUB16_28505 [Priestia sp. OVL9]|nr:hypothetical protein [Priestia sp. OVL9]